MICVCVTSLLAAFCVLAQTRGPSVVPGAESTIYTAVRDVHTCVVNGSTATCRVPLLANDALHPSLFACGAPHTASQGHSTLHFTDRAGAAQLLNGPKQRSLSTTAPHCAFDQWDVTTQAWDRGTFCLPEIMTGGAAVGDVDGDGLDDIYYTRWDARDALFRAKGDGTFEDVTEAAGLGSTADVHSNAVLLFDIDNDGDLDIFVTTVGSPRFYLYVNDGTAHFTEEAIERGAAVERPNVAAGAGGLTSSFSIAVADYDNDGYLDVYTTEWFTRLQADMTFYDEGVADKLSTCKLLHNLGAAAPGHFEDVTYAVGLRVEVAGRRMPSIKYTNTEESIAQLRLTVKDHFAAAGLDAEEVEERTMNVLEDLKRSHAVDEQRNAGWNAINEHLAETGRTISLPVHTMAYRFTGVFQFSARFADLNRDGYPDLVISGDFGTTTLYWGNVNGTFTRGKIHPLWDSVDNSMGAAIGDVDGDGYEDILFTSMRVKLPQHLQMDRFFPNAGIAASFEGNHLYLNDRGNHLFIDATETAGVREAYWAWGAVLADLDNDGHLDSYIVNGLDDVQTTDDDFAVNTPNVLFRNLGVHVPASDATSATATRVKFETYEVQAGVDDRREGRAVLTLDVNNDGNLDMFVSNHGDHPALWMNDMGSQHSSLRIRVKEAHCPRAAGAPPSSQRCVLMPRDSLGARVWMYVSPESRAVYRELGSSAAFMAHSELVAHFGLGPAVHEVHHVRIEWPATGSSVDMYNVPAQHTLTVHAPDVRGSHQVWDFDAVPDMRIGPDGRVTQVPSYILPLCTHLLPRIVSVSTPSAGRVDIAANQRYVTVVPPAGFNGNISFSYTAEVIGPAGTPLQSTADVVVRVTAGVAVPLSPATSAAPTSVAAADARAMKRSAAVVCRSARGPFPLQRVANASSASMNVATAHMAMKPRARISARLVSNELFQDQRAEVDNSATPLVPNALFVYFTMTVMMDLVDTYDTPNAATQGDLAQLRTSTFAISVPRFDATMDAEGAGNVALPHNVVHGISPAADARACTLSILGPQPPPCNPVSRVPPLADAHFVYGATPSVAMAVKAGAALPGSPSSKDGVTAGGLSMELAESHGRRVFDGMHRHTMTFVKPEHGHVNALTTHPYPRSVGPTPRPGDNDPKRLIAGDRRVSIHPGVIAIQTIFAREHNRIAGALRHLPAAQLEAAARAAGVHRAADAGDAIFAISSQIVIALYQKILWMEWMPVLLGANATTHVYAAAAAHDAAQDRNACACNNSVLAQAHGQSSCSCGLANMTDAFAFGAAFAWLGLLPNHILLLTPRTVKAATSDADASSLLQLRDVWFDARLTAETGVMPILAGARAQPAHAFGTGVVSGARNQYLSRNAFGQDLLADVIEHARDAEAPTLDAVRATFGLPPHTLVPRNGSSELVDANSHVASTGGGGSRRWGGARRRPRQKDAGVDTKALGRAFPTGADAVDILVGGLLERPAPAEPAAAAAAVGETFTHILADALLRVRNADACWYDKPDSPRRQVWLALEAAGVALPQRMADLLQHAGVTDMQGSVFRTPPADNEGTQ